MRKLRIKSTGAYFPKTIVTSKQLEEKMGIESGWIESKTGIISRRYVSGIENSPYMAARALEQALNKANIKFTDLDLLISASGTMAQPIPCNAALFQKAMGEENSGVPCFDYNSTCLSFVTALDQISYAMELNAYKRVAIVSSEVASIGLNYNEKESASIMGDGAAAIIIESCDRSGVIASKMNTYSSGASYTEIRSGGSKLHPRDAKPEDLLFNMDGPKVFLQAARLLPNFYRELVNSAGIGLEEVDLIIPHQASKPSLDFFKQKLNIPSGHLFEYYREYGNIIAASIPIGIHLAIESGELKHGDHLCLLGTSAGFSIGGLIMKI